MSQYADEMAEIEAAEYMATEEGRVRKTYRTMIFADLPQAEREDIQESIAGVCGRTGMLDTWPLESLANLLESLGRRTLAEHIRDEYPES